MWVWQCDDNVLVDNACTTAALLSRKRTCVRTTPRAQQRNADQLALILEIDG